MQPTRALESLSPEGLSPQNSATVTVSVGPYRLSNPLERARCHAFCDGWLANVNLEVMTHTGLFREANSLLHTTSQEPWDSCESQSLTLDETDLQRRLFLLPAELREELGFERKERDDASEKIPVSNLLVPEPFEPFEWQPSLPPSLPLCADFKELALGDSARTHRTKRQRKPHWRRRCGNNTTLVPALVPGRNETTLITSTEESPSFKKLSNPLKPSMTLRSWELSAASTDDDEDE